MLTRILRPQFRLVVAPFGGPHCLRLPKLRVPSRLLFPFRSFRQIVAPGVMLLAMPRATLAFGGVAGCPADFGALRGAAEEVRNPTVRASAHELPGRGAAMSVYGAGGLEGFAVRQRVLIDEWCAFPIGEAFEADQASIIAIYQG